MVEVEIAGGVKVLVDDPDEIAVRQLAWRLSPKGEPRVQYRDPDNPTLNTSITLKAFLLGVRVKTGHAVKNLNGNPLDCRRCNLRHMTLKEARALDLKNHGPKARRPKVVRKNIRQILGMDQDLKR